MRTGRRRARSQARRPAVFAAALVTLLALGQTSLEALADPPVDSPGPPSADGVQPVIRDTQSSNDDCGQLGFDHGVSIAGNGQVSGGDLTITVSGYNSPTGFADWSSTQSIHGVYVKGGPSGGNLFSYPAGDTADQDLHTPQKPDGGYYSVSHLAFCWNDVALEPDVTVTKANEPAGVVLAGDEITYTLAVSNEGQGDATGVVVTDELPIGVSFVSATPGCNESAGTVTCTVGDVGPGAALDLEITVSVDEATCGAIANVATVEASNETGEATENDASNEVTNTVECSEPAPPDLQVTKSSSAEGILGEGDTFTYTITVTNVGDVEATGLELVDVLPEGDVLGVTLPPLPTLGSTPCTVTSSTSTGGATHTEVRCAGATLAPGASESVTIGVVVLDDVCGPITNVADVSAANEPARNVGPDNHAEASDEIECAPRIQVVKGGPDLAHVGDPVTYTFAVRNDGSVDLTDVALSDPMCDGEIEPVDDGDGDEVLAIGERWDYRCVHVVTAGDGSSFTNTATVEGTHEGGKVTDTDDHVVEVIHPGIAIDKSASPTSGPAGTRIVYTYLVTNTGDTTLYEINVTDDVLGPIGAIPSLGAGADASLTFEITLGSAPVTNVGTASGEDVLGEVVTADDAATVTVVAAGGDDSGGGSPFTGTDVRGALGLAALMLLMGSALVLGVRRRSRATG